MVDPPTLASFSSFSGILFPLEIWWPATRQVDSVKDRHQLSPPLLDFPLLLAGLPEPASIQVMSASLRLKMLNAKKKAKIVLLRVW